MMKSKFFAFQTFTSNRGKPFHFLLNIFSGEKERPPSNQPLSINLFNGGGVIIDLL